MNTTQDRLTPARRYLEVFAESWKADHEAANALRNFEGRLAEAIRVFWLVYELVQRRRECVYLDLQEPNPALDLEEKQLFENWFSLVSEDLPILGSLEQTYGAVEGAEVIRECLERARVFVSQWTPAVPAKAIGSRVIYFSEEDSAPIQQILQSSPGCPGRPTRPPRAIPTADPSILK